jgi:hypothetical protein
MTIAVDPKSLSPVGLCQASRRRREFWRAALALSIFCAFLVWTLIIRSPFLSIEDSDDAFFLEVAHLWMRGVLPYAGAFDIKPPGFFSILAVAETFLGSGLETLKVVSIFFDAVAATALYFLGCRMGSRGIGVFAALLYPFLSETVTDNAAYAPLAAFTTLAFLAALSPLPIVKRAALAGLAIGAAFVVKQTAAFEGIALFVVILGARDAASQCIGAGLAFGLGAAVAPLGFLLYFAGHGAAEVMIADVVVKSMFRPGSAMEGVSFLNGVLRSLVFLAKPIAPILALACLAPLRRHAIAAAAPNADIRAIGLWAASAILSVWAQHALFRAYLGPTLAPLLLLAGAGVVFAAPEFKRIAIPLRLAFVSLITVAATMASSNVSFEMRHETSAIAMAAEAIKASHPAPVDKLFVVGDGMWLYTMTDLTPPTPYFHWEHTLCDFPGAGPDRLADALATKPRYIVVANRPHYMCELPQSWRQVDAILARSYRLLTRAQGNNWSYDVYEALLTPAI